MTAKQLASLRPSEVRNSEQLMRLYISEYKGVFGYTPNCAGCSFKNDWKKFTKAIMSATNDKQLTIKPYKMSSKKFKLKKQFANEILWYKKKDSESGKEKVYRVYGRHMSDDFAKEYLAEGKKEEIDGRKSKFEKLPEGEKTESKKTTKKKSKPAADKKADDKE